MKRKSRARSAGAEFLAFDGVSIRLGEKIVFKNTHWIWRAGEQWAFLGRDGAGKSSLVQAILGRAILAEGEVREPPSLTGGPAPTIAHVSPAAQRELATQESSFYQLRWHSGLEQGPRTVAEYLSQESVADHNPFEVEAELSNRAEFLRRQRLFAQWLDIGGLWRRKLIHLSNGEMRRTMLVHALLKSPDLLILEDAQAGLDAATRQRLGRVISRLVKARRPVLVVTHRPEEIPAGTTHLVLVDNHQVVAHGPRPEMLELWHHRLGAGDGGGGRAPQARRNRTEAGVRAKEGAPQVELSRVTVKGAKRRILRDISWTLRAGECWALLGPNGAGKTTLLNLIQGDHPQVYAVDIRYFGHRADSTQRVWRARRHIGWMSPELHQHYPGSWSAEDTVCSGFFNSVGLHEACSPRQRRQARRCLAELGLGSLAGTPFGELSFGQQRLLLLARSVVKKPRVLILDEPCQGLDAGQRRTLLEAVDRLVLQTGTSLIFVTHHQDEMPGCITHVLRLSAGRIRSAVRRK